MRATRISAAPPFHMSRSLWIAAAGRSPDVYQGFRRRPGPGPAPVFLSDRRLHRVAVAVDAGPGAGPPGVHRLDCSAADLEGAASVPAAAPPALSSARPGCGRRRHRQVSSPGRAGRPRRRFPGRPRCPARAAHAVDAVRVRRDADLDAGREGGHEEPSRGEQHPQQAQGQGAVEEAGTLRSGPAQPVAAGRVAPVDRARAADPDRSSRTRHQFTESRPQSGFPGAGSPVSGCSVTSRRATLRICRRSTATQTVIDHRRPGVSRLPSGVSTSLRSWNVTSARGPSSMPSVMATRRLRPKLAGTGIPDAPSGRGPRPSLPEASG